jgi:hypothetical protein
LAHEEPLTSLIVPLFPPTYTKIIKKKIMVEVEGMDETGLSVSGPVKCNAKGLISGTQVSVSLNKKKTWNGNLWKIP